MLGPNARVRVYVCKEPTDMRKSFSGLCGAVRSVVGKDPLSGHVFCFFNRNRNYVKLLFWERSGYCIIAKKLARGVFSSCSKPELSIAELSQVLEGVKLNSVRKHRQYEYIPS
jgi:transposase